MNQRPVRARMLTLLIVGLIVAGGLAGAAGARAQATPAAAVVGCNLPGQNGAVQHVILLHFDNVHFARDTPNVPSDLEQMPHLLNFLENNGVVMTNQHTPLIAHTASDLLSTITGLYGDRTGVPISNSYRFFNPDGSSSTGVSFNYWTSPIFSPNNPASTDTSWNMLTAPRTNTPAPWAPFTKAGCNVGSVALANTVLENTGVDVPTVFGADSPEAAEVQSDPDKAMADFVGFAVHCAKSSPLCSSANGGVADLLPSEPGGYAGYNALFGNKSVAPQINPDGPMKDLAGNPVQDPNGNAGFPGFDGMSAAVSLSYVAAMQEHGVPVTYAYLSDAHDKHPAGPAYGPGEAGYVAALKNYDAAFATFFHRLNADGITPANTLFVVSADENDHFAGSAPKPANCDGITIPCTYDTIGEANVNLTGLLAPTGANTNFAVHADSAANFYVNGNPGPSDPALRTLERTVVNQTVTNPFTGATEPYANYLADPIEMKVLHMITADPARTPSFTLFAKPDYFLFTGDPNCDQPCVAVNPGFAWNHGTVSPDINDTWAGFVGPGVKMLGVDSKTWADQSDIRPTVMALLGLRDAYVHDGRVLVEEMENAAAPAAIVASRDSFVSLAELYKQVNAPLGEFGMTSLTVATAAVKTDSPGDADFGRWEGALAAVSGHRDALAVRIAQLLTGAAFNGEPIDAGLASALIAQGQTLIAQMHALETAPPAPLVTATPGATPTK
jgi:hypothetical protein